MNIFTAAIGNDRKLKVIFYDKTDKKRKVITFDISGNPSINEFSNYISSNTNICSGNEKYKNYPFISPNSNGFVDIDTGAIIFSTKYMDILYSLIDTEEKYFKIVNFL